MTTSRQHLCRFFESDAALFAHRLPPFPTVALLHPQSFEARVKALSGGHPLKLWLSLLESSPLVTARLYDVAALAKIADTDVGSVLALLREFGAAVRCADDAGRLTSPLPA